MARIQTASQTLVQYKPAVSDGAGTFTFVASYPADSANMNAATTTSCPDTSGTENITLIGTTSSTSDQRWLPNDRVTLSTSGGTLTGTLTVSLYSGTFTVTNGVCTPIRPDPRRSPGSRIRSPPRAPRADPRSTRPTRRSTWVQVLLKSGWRQRHLWLPRGLLLACPLQRHLPDRSKGSLRVVHRDDQSTDRGKEDLPCREAPAKAGASLLLVRGRIRCSIAYPMWMPSTRAGSSLVLLMCVPSDACSGPAESRFGG